MKNLVFFGSSPFSVPVLQGLIEHTGVSSVVTFPDKPVGRHLRLTPNPVKVLAQKHDIKVFESQADFRTSLLSPSLAKEGETRQGEEVLALVAAYGRIIKPEILSIFNNHIYNIHPSLLPKYRGPSPLQQQILDGISETGVTIIQLDNEMDHGPILFQKSTPLLPDDTIETLGKRLFSLGTQEFIKLLNNDSLKIKNLKLKIQDDSLASYTSKLTKQSGFVEFEKFRNYLLALRSSKSEVGELAKMYRAFSPWPGVWTISPDNKRIKLISINPVLFQIEGQSKPVTQLPY